MSSSRRDHGRHSFRPRICGPKSTTTSSTLARKALQLSFELGKGCYATILVKCITAGLIMIELDVLYEDNHCLAVNKPAGLLSQGDRSGDPSLVEVASRYLKTRYAEAWKGVRGAAASSGPAGVGRDDSRQDEQGGRATVGAISLGENRKTLLGDR